MSPTVVTAGSHQCLYPQGLAIQIPACLPAALAFQEKKIAFSQNLSISTRPENIFVWVIFAQFDVGIGTPLLAVIPPFLNNEPVIPKAMELFSDMPHHHKGGPFG